MTALDFPTSPSNGDTYENYVYDSTDGVWKRIAAGIELNGISDVTLSSPTTDQLLRWNGTEWVNGTANTDSIADDAITAAKLADTAGAVMVFADDTARGSAIPSPTEGMVTYRSDDDALEVYDGSSWNAVGPGKILQVVSTTLTSAFTTPSTSPTDITGLATSITPSATSSKILGLLTIGAVDRSTIGFAYGDVTRDGTQVGIGDVNGSQSRVGWGIVNAGGNQPQSVAWNFLDTPASTSSLTYQARFFVESGTGYINRAEVDSNTVIYFRSISTLTLMEVAG